MLKYWVCSWVIILALNVCLKLYLKLYLGSPLNMVTSKNHINIHLANLYFSCSWAHYIMAEPYCNHYGKRFFQSMIANRHWWSTTLIIRHNNDSYTHTHFYIAVSKRLWFTHSKLCVLATTSLIVVLYYWLLESWWTIIQNQFFGIWKKYKKTAIM